MVDIHTGMEDQEHHTANPQQEKVDIHNTQSDIMIQDTPNFKIKALITQKTQQSWKFHKTLMLLNKKHY
jgi:hypothetical protein